MSEKTEKPVLAATVDVAELKRTAEAVKQSYAALCEHGGDELADAWSSAEVAYDDAANPDVVLALIAENEALRRDAERYQWFRIHSLRIVHSSTGPWVSDLDRVIDEEIAVARAKGIRFSVDGARSIR